MKFKLATLLWLRLRLMRVLRERERKLPLLCDIKLRGREKGGRESLMQETKFSYL